MALITLGAMVTDARGSVGGSVFSRNTAGAYARARTKPINPNTPLQSQVRANFGVNSKAWSGTLTQAQNAAWTAFAQGNPQVNRLGASIVLSGLAMYNKLNQVLAQLGSAPELDPPADLSVIPLAPVLSLAVDRTADTITLTTAAQAVTAGSKYYIFATPAVAGGKKPPASAYRFLEAHAATAAAVVIDITTAWQAAFGDWVVGQAIGVTVATVNVATGATTTPVVFNAVST
jgi:hypothetical protein